MANSSAPPDEPKKRQGRVFAVFYALAVLMGFLAVHGPLNGMPDAFGPGALGCLGLLLVGGILQFFRI
jgi:hypothetical protein